MFIPVKPEASKWPGYTLVVPAVSVGNVGQLTADLLISTLAATKVGSFYDDSFLAVTGNDPFALDNETGSCNLMTAMEAFECQRHKVVIVQQRSPLIRGKRQQFLDKLLDWITASGFSEVIILTSLFSHERLDSQLVGSQLRYLVTPKLKESAGKIFKDSLQWMELETRACETMPSDEGQGNNSDIFMPGGGIAKLLYEQCCQQDIKAAVVMTFCSEGDNSPDAIQLASYLNAWKQWLPQQVQSTAAGIISPWNIPTSWKLMFGSSFDQILFR